MARFVQSIAHMIAQHATERLMPGEMVDDFLVWEQVHAGAQGVVYRVTGPDSGASLLMKVPRFQSNDAAETLLSYETEARILPMLSGPHVPRFYGSGDMRRLPYIVLEQIDGHSLSQELVRCPLPPAEVERIGAAVADALHELHRQDAVHCDLKPDNIMLKRDGTAVLIDFGFAWHARFPDLLGEEQRLAAGSAPYISPEQLLGVRGDPRSDLFALGVILYELATGELPFGIPVSQGGMRQRLWMDPDPPRMLAPEVTPGLQEIILRCLEPDAAQRYQSAALLAFDLRHSAQVEHTERARRDKPLGFFRQARRWWKARRAPLQPPLPPRRALDAAPVIMVALDTTHATDERQPAILRTTGQVLSLSQEFRLVCVSVVRDPDEPQHHLGLLREWTAPLALPPERLSLHVMVALDAAGALVEFAHANNVSLIVLGAPRPSQEALAWWRSVASGVTANAHCSVHVVRVPAPTAPPARA